MVIITKNCRSSVECFCQWTIHATTAFSFSTITFYNRLETHDLHSCPHSTFPHADFHIAYNEALSNQDGKNLYSNTGIQNKMVFNSSNNNDVETPFKLRECSFRTWKIAQQMSTSFTDQGFGCLHLKQ
jgi:hypothetical protein